MENLSFGQKVQELWIMFRGGDGCSYPCNKLHRQNCSRAIARGRAGSWNTLGLSTAAGFARIRDLGCWDGKSSRLHTESCRVPGKHEVSHASLLLTSKTSHIHTPHTTCKRVYRPGIPSAIDNKFSPKSFIDPSLENTSRSPKTTRIKDDGWNLACSLEPYYSDNYWLNVLIFRKIQKHLERIALPLVIFAHLFMTFLA